MALTSHSKLINKAVRETLKPIGIKRKGQSRTWYDDHGWWVIVIEFQPSNRSKGTFLNVGINFQWYAHDYFSFDIGYRESGFIEYKSDKQFEPKALELAQVAKNKTLKIREQFLSNFSANKFVKNALKKNENATIWSYYNLGMMSLLSGDTKQSIDYFNTVVNSSEDREWALDLKKFTNKLLKQLSSNYNTNDFLCEVITESRNLKNLAKWSCDFG